MEAVDDNNDAASIDGNDCNAGGGDTDDGSDDEVSLLSC